MKLLFAKYALTALIVVVASEVAKRSDRLGAFISSLPLVTILVMIWLYMEGQGRERVANHAMYTFWYVLPSLPLFLLLPYLLGRGIGFWPALLFSLVVTAFSFVLVSLLARQFGVELLP